MKKIHLPPFKWEASLAAHQIAFPSDKGDGAINLFDLNCGMQLVTMNYKPHQTTVLEYTPPFTATLDFEFHLSGVIEAHPSCLKKAVVPQPDRGSLRYSAYNDSYSETVGPERVARMGVLLNREQLAAFLGKGDDSLPVKFQGNPQGRRSYDCMLTPHMREVMRQIFNCPFQGSIRHLFLESKALELMAYVMEQVVSQDNRRAGSPTLKPGDVERVRHAAHLLAGDLENTPNLNELASSVGMCRSKLHQCFRMVYGITPFDYLRNRRLETAMLYLTERGMNVTEASYAVGYSSPSYFTRSFKQYFGHPPSQCRKASVSAINER